MVELRSIHDSGHRHVLLSGHLFFFGRHGAEPEKPLCSGNSLFGAAEPYGNGASGPPDGPDPPHGSPGAALSDPAGLLLCNLGGHKSGERRCFKRRLHDFSPAAFGAGGRRHNIPVRGQGNLVLPGGHVRRESYPCSGGDLYRRPGRVPTGILYPSHHLQSGDRP